jgi:hypothetical protein
MHLIDKFMPRAPSPVHNKQDERKEDDISALKVLEPRACLDAEEKGEFEREEVEIAVERKSDNEEEAEKEDRKQCYAATSIATATAPIDDDIERGSFRGGDEHAYPPER